LYVGDYSGRGAQEIVRQNVWKHIQHVKAVEHIRALQPLIGRRRWIRNNHPSGQRKGQIQTAGICRAGARISQFLPVAQRISREILVAEHRVVVPMVGGGFPSEKLRVGSGAHRQPVNHRTIGSALLDEGIGRIKVVLPDHIVGAHDLPKGSGIGVPESFLGGFPWPHLVLARGERLLPNPRTGSAWNGRYHIGDGGNIRPDT